MRNNLFAELRAEFHDEMSELRDDLSVSIINTTNQLVSCHIIFCPLLIGMSVNIY